MTLYAAPRGWVVECNNDLYPDAPTLPSLEQEQTSQNNNDSSPNSTHTPNGHSHNSSNGQNKKKTQTQSASHSANGHSQTDTNTEAKTEAKTQATVAQESDVDDDLNEILGLNPKSSNNSKKRQRQISENEDTSAINHALPPKKKRKKTNNSPKLIHKTRNKRAKHKQTRTNLEQILTNDIDICSENIDTDIGNDWKELLINLKTFSRTHDTKIRNKYGKEIAKLRTQIQKLETERSAQLQSMKARIDQLRESSVNKCKKLEKELKEKNTKLQKLTQIESDLSKRHKLIKTQNCEMKKEINCFEIEKKAMETKNGNDMRTINDLQTEIEKQRSLNGNVSEFERRNNELEQSNKVLVKWNKNSRKTIADLESKLQKYECMKWREIGGNMEVTGLHLESESIEFDRGIFTESNGSNNNGQNSLKNEMGNVCEKEESFVEEYVMDCGGNKAMNEFEFAAKFEKEKRKKVEFKNKYKECKEKVSELEQKIQGMLSQDWRGQIVNEYANSDGEVLYDMKWDVSKGMRGEDLVGEDLDRWQMKKRDGTHQ